MLSDRFSQRITTTNYRVLQSSNRIRRASSFLNAVDEKQRNIPSRKSGHSPQLRSQLLLRRTISRHPASTVLSFAWCCPLRPRPSASFQVRNRKRRAARKTIILSLMPQKGTVLASVCARPASWQFSKKNYTWALELYECEQKKNNWRNKSSGLRKNLCFLFFFKCKNVERKISEKL